MQLPIYVPQTANLNSELAKNLMDISRVLRALSNPPKDPPQKKALPTSAHSSSTSRLITLTGDVLGSGIANVPTALANILTPGSAGSPSAVPSIVYDSKGRLTSVSSSPILITESQVTNLISDLAGKAPLSHTQAWSTITATPTTLSGYGISATDTLFSATYSPKAGSSSITTVGTLTAGSIPASLITGLPTYEPTWMGHGWNPNTADFNNYTGFGGSGLYNCNIDTATANAPTASLDHAVFGFGGNARHVQIASPYDSNSLWYRRNNGSWQSWQQIAMMSNIPSSYAWSAITSTPTTVSGYGITDIQSQVISSYAIGPNTALANTDTIVGAFDKVQAQLNGKQASGSYLTANQTITVSGDASGSGSTAIALTLASIITAGSAGSASSVPVLGYDAKGRLTSVSSATIAIPESQVTGLVSDLSLKAPLASPTFSGTVTTPSGTMTSTAATFSVPVLGTLQTHSTYNDNVNGAPWYGVGYNSTNFTQLGGYNGVRIQTGTYSSFVVGHQDAGGGDSFSINSTGATFSVPVWSASTLNLGGASATQLSLSSSVANFFVPVAEQGMTKVTQSYSTTTALSLVAGQELQVTQTGSAVPTFALSGLSKGQHCWLNIQGNCPGYYITYNNSFGSVTTLVYPDTGCHSFFITCLAAGYSVV